MGRSANVCLWIIALSTLVLAGLGVEQRISDDDGHDREVLEEQICVSEGQALATIALAHATYGGSFSSEAIEQQTQYLEDLADYVDHECTP